MFSRITFILITAFWLTMTYLLWRSEYVGKNEVGSNVPLELVWRKILTAPDRSSLEILHHDKKIGECDWESKVGEDLANSTLLADEGTPNPAAEKPPTNYRLDIQGSVTLPDVPGHVAFHSEISLSTHDQWQDFHVQLTVPPTTWNINAHASEQSVRLITQTKGEPKSEQVFKFADLQNPQALLRDFDLPVLGLLGVLNPFPQNATAGLPSLGLQWKARNDWIAFGHTSVRAYRLEAVVLERYRMIVIVSQVGEILRVDLPDGWELLNNNLIDL